MADPKYATLPGIDTESPDVYETDDLPEDDRAQHEEDVESASVDNLKIDTNAAYKHFKHTNVSSLNVDFSDKISKQRRTGYDIELTEYELLGDANRELPETPRQKYQRLQHEIRQLTEELSHIEDSSKESAAGDKLGPVQICQQLEYLQRQMNDLHLDDILGPNANVNASDPQGILQKRLLTQLESFKASSSRDKSSQKGGKTAAVAGDSVAYELHYKPEQAQFSKNAKLSSMEERLERLEAVVGQRADKLNALTCDTDNKSLLAAVSLLDSKLTLLDPAQLDQIEARLQSISHKLGQVIEKSSETPQQQSKICELYEIVRKWEGLSETLPHVVERLVGLKDLHEQALQFSQTLTYLDAGQQQLTSSLTTHSDMLKKLQDTFVTNNGIIKTNIDSLQKRVDNLQK